MFKENFNHFVGFLSDEVMFRNKKMELNNKKRNYFMFSLTYIFLFLLVFKVLGFF